VILEPSLCDKEQREVVGDKPLHARDEPSDEGGSGSTNLGLSCPADDAQSKFLSVSGGNSRHDAHKQPGEDTGAGGPLQY
jgi:hypothetical protein